MAAKNMNSEQLQQSLKEGGKPVLVEFWAPWCVYCRRIGPAFDKLAGQMADKLVVGKINIDEEPALAERERIEVVPTLLLYRDGRVIGSIVAPDSKAVIEEFLREHLGE